MVKELLLGKKTDYVNTYSPGILHPVSRSLARSKSKIADPLPFTGADIWNGTELSWLNSKGKPEIALGEFTFPCTSPFIVESKSFKLYLNSFNQSSFSCLQEVCDTLVKDLSNVVQAKIGLKLLTPDEVIGRRLASFNGTCLDNLDISTDTYNVNPSFLKISEEIAEETLYSNLLKSNCLATGQPDWGSLLVRYKGKKLDPDGLLKYIISYRNHEGFAEHCVEQIYQDIMLCCKPEYLTVYARYTKRGGLDINPFRSNFEEWVDNQQQFRQ